MNRYRLVSNTGKRLTCSNYNAIDKIQKKLSTKGIKTTMQVQRGKA